MHRWEELKANDAVSALISLDARGEMGSRHVFRPEEHDRVLLRRDAESLEDGYAWWVCSLSSCLPACLLLIPTYIPIPTRLSFPVYIHHYLSTYLYTI
jgi:hypothetical protein